MASDELLKQIKSEFKEIVNAPTVPFGPTIPVCHFCGRIQSSHEDLEPTIHGSGHEQVTRYKGKCCSGR